VARRLISNALGNKEVRGITPQLDRGAVGCVHWGWEAR
jgi:hypothetical protein